MEAVRYYDSIGGEAYDQQHPPKQFFISFIRKLIDPGYRVLEVGCGTGSCLLTLVETSPSLIAGIEPSKELLLTARRKLPSKAFLALGDGAFLPFPDMSFDIVFARGIMHHTRAQLEIVREMARVSRHHIVINEATGAVGRLLRRLGLRRCYPTHPDYPDADYWGGPDQGPCYFPRFFEILNMLKDMGYKVRVIKDKPYISWFQKPPQATIVRAVLPWWLLATGIIHAYVTEQHD